MKDNGSSFEIAKKVEQFAENQHFPEVIEITTGNLFSQRDVLTFKNSINEELQRRFPYYVVKNESDITFFAGMMKARFTKIKEVKR
jgi:hypothetical protein